MMKRIFRFFKNLVIFGCVAFLLLALAVRYGNVTRTAVDRVTAPAVDSYKEMQENIKLPRANYNELEAKLDAATSWLRVTFYAELAAEGGMPAKRQKKLAQAVNHLVEMDEGLRGLTRVYSAEGLPKVVAYQQLRDQLWEEAARRAPRYGVTLPPLDQEKW